MGYPSERGRNYTPPEGSVLRPAGGFLRKADDCPQRSGFCQSSQGKLHFPCAGCRQLPLCGLAARKHLALQAVPVQQVYKIILYLPGLIEYNKEYNKKNDKSEFVEEKRVMNLEDLRIDCAIKQKRGIHFISASIVIWLLVMMVQFLDLPILTKNLLTFCCTAPLLPLAFLMSKLLKIQFQDKSNPLNNLGILFSINQILYLLIAMWIYPTVPEKMLMVIAMIFGAHLLPYSWLYKSKTYMIMSVLIPIASLIVGCNSTRLILALMMLVFEIIFTALLIIENRKI